MNAKISVFAISVEAMIYLLLYNLHDCTFKNIWEGMLLKMYMKLKKKLKIADKGF